MRRAVIIEARGGNDKGADGHRADSQPILDALGEEGYSGEIVFFAPSEADELEKQLVASASIVVSRINPGNLPDTDVYWQFLANLAKAGIVVQTHPEATAILSMKDLFFKLRGTGLVPPDTDFYRTPSELRQRFALSLATGPRVLKKNFTATGLGVWKVERLPDGSIRCIEAVDHNEKRFPDLPAFCRFLEPVFEEQLSAHPFYFRNRGGILDSPFLPGIQEGEIRVFLIHDRPCYVLHKKPKENGFSATLFSGAQYSSDSNLKRWSDVIEQTLWGLRKIQLLLGKKPLPVIWSIDSIPWHRSDGRTAYYFSDVNASAVGFSSPDLVLQMSRLIAKQLSSEVL